LHPRYAAGREHPLVALDFLGKVVREIGSVPPEQMPASGVGPSLALSPTPDGSGLTYSVGRWSETLSLIDGIASFELP
jgi:hypothetical protein